MTTPTLPAPVAVLVARDVPYLPHGHRLQTFNLYLPYTPENAALVGKSVRALPDAPANVALPRFLVHVHGGAWRDPQLNAASIEPTVAHAFSTPGGAGSIVAIASLNYTLTQFPTHPSLPYDASKNAHADPAREAVHPQHVRDVLQGLDLLRALGLRDNSYVLSGHSCGACLAFQAVLQAPRHYGLVNVSDAPCPAALLGVNGLYDLPALVDDLGVSHEHLREEYRMMLSNAFGPDRSTWPAASPAYFEPATVSERVSQGYAPRLVVVEQSADDQLVPMNQLEKLQANLTKVSGLQVSQGHRATGKHAEPWQRGDMLWNSVQDVLTHLRNGRTFKLDKSRLGV